LLLILFLPSLLTADQGMPWLPPPGEIQARATYLFQSYPGLDAARDSRHFSSNDHFLTLSAEASPYFALGELGPWFVRYPVSIALEFTVAKTRRQQWEFDNVSLTGRYRWLDDIGARDPITLTTGLTLIQPWSHAIKDPSSFHHGHFEGEFTISFGKE